MITVPHAVHASTFQLSVTLSFRHILMVKYLPTCLHPPAQRQACRPFIIGCLARHAAWK